MRSILALGLAALILAAEAPGLFVETPVCAAVDGAYARAKSKPHALSCCGSASCPMHAKGCGKDAECTLIAAYGEDPVVASVGPLGRKAPKMCAPSCGRQKLEAVPGTPDPGTIDESRSPEGIFASYEKLPRSTHRAKTRNRVPEAPPPRF
jgi:hypothetical protein